MVRTLAEDGIGNLLPLTPSWMKQNGRKIWLCQCDCGNTKTTTVTMLNSGKTSSCGCYKIEKQELIQQLIIREILDFIQYGVI